MEPPDRAETSPPARSDAGSKPRTRRVRRKPPVPTDTPGFAETIKDSLIDPVKLYPQIEQELAEYRQLIAATFPKARDTP